MIAKKIEACTVPLVTAGARCDIYRSTRGHSGREVEIDSGDLKFLYDFLRKAHSRATVSDLHNVAAVPRLLRARFQLRKLEKAAAVQRQPFDLGTSGHTCYAKGVILNLRRDT